MAPVKDIKASDPISDLNQVGEGINCRRLTVRSLKCHCRQWKQTQYKFAIFLVILHGTKSQRAENLCMLEARVMRKDFLEEEASN